MPFDWLILNMTLPFFSKPAQVIVNVVPAMPEEGVTVTLGSGFCGTEANCGWTMYDIVIIIATIPQNINTLIDFRMRIIYMMQRYPSITFF
jgi:hypothetical protein